MSLVEKIRKAVKNFPHTHELKTYGENAFFYNPGKKPRGKYFCTVKKGNLFNYPADKDKFYAEYGKIPRGTHTFGGRIRPHEHYAWMQWMTIENPTEEEICDCLEEAFNRTKK